MKYTLLNWSGGEMDLDVSSKSKNMNTSEAFLAGICAVLYLLSETISSSFMIIVSGNECIDPEKVLSGYLISHNIMNENILDPLKHMVVERRYSAILGYLKHNFLFQFDNMDFINGVRYCCKILGRNPKKIILYVKDHSVTDDITLSSQLEVRQKSDPTVHYRTRLSQ